MPGLSTAALRALQALHEAGADVGADDLARQAHPGQRPPVAEAHAAAVSAAWSKVQADATCRAELEQFAGAAQGRLGHPDLQASHKSWHWREEAEPDARPEGGHAAHRAVGVWATRIDNARALSVLHEEHEARHKQEAEQQERAEQRKREAASLREAEQARFDAWRSRVRPLRDFEPGSSGPGM